MSYLEIKNLCTIWPEITITFSESIEKGKMLCIAGQSGSGKSTVLRMISGLIKCEQKNVAHPIFNLDGKSLLDIPPEKRNIGMVFQHHALFLHMRVDDNVAYGLRCRGISKKDSRKIACSFLEQFNLSGFATRYPDSLSGGEAQRVSLARTLIVQPNLVLFDEPFASLDKPLRRKLANDIRTIQANLGFTGILVTHDIDEVKSMSDKVTVMKHGNQIWSGSPDLFTEELL